MPTDPSILLVVNPTSGRGRGRRTAEGLTARLQARGRTVVVQETKQRGDAERFVRDLLADPKRQYGCVVACGGDGTIQEIANALALTDRVGPRPVLGLAPAGRCNDFSRVLGISRDVDAIADVLLDGRPRPLDLGRVNGRCFCTVVTVGVDADVSSFVDGMRMPLSGTIAYLYGTLRVLARYRPRSLRISGDFGVIEEPVFLASTANTSLYGGAIPIAPDAVPDDGKLDLCVIQHVSVPRMLTLVPKVLRGRHAGEPEIRLIRTTHLKIESVEPLELWADGERIAETPATIDVLPGCVDVLMPRDFHFAKRSRDDRTTERV